MKYYYSNAQNQTTGPVEWEELQRLAGQGVVSDQTPVIPEGGQAWTTYGQVRSGTALASGLSHASTAAAAFPWGSMIFGILLSVVGGLALPWTVFSSAAREVADWGKQRALPLASSDMPVLTFYIIVLRSSTLVIFGLFFTICAFLSLFGTGPVYGGFYGLVFWLRPAAPFMYGAAHWNAALAFLGFFYGLLVAYLGQVAIAFWFEILSIGVRIANDVKRMAAK